MLPVPFIYIILSVVLRESMFSLLVIHSHQCPANTILHLNTPPTRIQLLLIIFAHWTRQREIIGTVSPSLKSNKHTLRYIQANNFLASYKIHCNTSSILAKRCSLSFLWNKMLTNLTSWTPWLDAFSRALPCATCAGCLEEERLSIARAQPLCWGHMTPCFSQGKTESSVDLRLATPATPSRNMHRLIETE